MTVLESASPPKPRFISLHISRWARAAAIGICVALGILLNQFDDCAGLGGMVESAGWPLWFLRYDGNTGTTTLVLHGLLVDLAVWAGILVGIWYGTAGAAEKQTTRGQDAEPTPGHGPTPNTGMGALHFR